MKEKNYISDINVKWFEDEQKQFGTKVAMHNLIWTVATDILSTIGEKHIHTCDDTDCKSTCDDKE